MKIEILHDSVTIDGKKYVLERSTTPTEKTGDPVVRFLSELETRYSDNPEELAKVKAIKVRKDSVEIAGLKLKRENESAPADGKNVFDNGGHALFRWNKAKNLFGVKMPSDSQWEAILNAIPGKSDEKTHGENFRSVLSVPLAGCRDPYGGLQPVGAGSSPLVVGRFRRVRRVRLVPFGYS
jgi:hypothetical protein